jgi:hypothetical protein
MDQPSIGRSGACRAAFLPDSRFQINDAGYVSTRVAFPTDLTVSILFRCCLIFFEMLVLGGI